MKRVSGRDEDIHRLNVKLNSLEIVKPSSLIRSNSEK